MGGALGTLVIIPFVYARFAYGVYGEDRWPLIMTAYNMFKANLLFGVGANNYNFVVMKYIPPSMTTAWVFTVHDEYLLRIAETGFVGFCFYYYLIWTVTKEFYRGMATRNNLLFPGVMWSIFSLDSLVIPSPGIHVSLSAGLSTSLHDLCPSLYCECYPKGRIVGG